MTRTYFPEPGAHVRVRRWEVPCPELPDGPKRKLAVQFTGMVTAVDGTGESALMYLDPHSLSVSVDTIGEPGQEADHAMTGLGYVFLGQEPGHGYSWTLETEVEPDPEMLPAPDMIRYAERLIRRDHRVLDDDWAFWGQLADHLNEMATIPERTAGDWPGKWRGFNRAATMAGAYIRMIEGPEQP